MKLLDVNQSGLPISLLFIGFGICFFLALITKGDK